jgi:multimeric flavodoxin WrbA
MILGIVGSPRKGRLTDQLVSSALKGAESKGAKIQKIYLIDHEIKPLKFLSSDRSGCPEELNSLCEEADAYVLGAPVYYGDINGLTKDFMDTVRISNSNGKYGLGISIAGGSGKNLGQAIHSIYHWFYDRQIRGVDPTPVCRFNFKKALQSLNQSGIILADLSKTRKKFDAFPHIEDWIEHYEQLNMPPSSPLDEILLVTKHLLETSNKYDDMLQAKKEHEKAKSLIKRGKRIEAIKHAVKAYKTLFYS